VILAALVLARKQRLVAGIFTCNMVQSCHKITAGHSNSTSRVVLVVRTSSRQKTEAGHWYYYNSPSRVILAALVLARKQRLVAGIFTCNMVQSCHKITAGHSNSTSRVALVVRTSSRQKTEAGHWYYTCNISSLIPSPKQTKIYIIRYTWRKPASSFPRFLVVPTR
jgi:hypothetical protein